MDDEPTGSIETDLSVSVGGTIVGTIEEENDVDFIAVELQAGITYQIDLEGSRTGAGTLGDPFLTGVFTENGNQAANSNDDGGVRANSRIVFTPIETGTYYIGASNFDNVSFEDTGTYTVFVEEEALSLRPDPVDVESIGLSGNAAIDPLIAGVRYTVGADGITEVSYSIPDANSEFLVEFDLDGQDLTQTFQPADSITLSAFEGALAFAAGVTNLEFNEVPDEGTIFGTIRIADAGTTSGNVAGVAGLPSEVLTGGDIFIVESRLGSGSLREYVVIHEFAHALGLTHPDEGLIQETALFNGAEFTVMASSFASSFFTDAARANLYPTSLGYLDILALQHLYGVDETAFAENNIYTFDVSDRYFETLYDLGGSDTIQITGSGESVVIDLTPNEEFFGGAFINVGTTVTYFNEDGQSVGQRSDTIFVSPETVIENIIAADGDDRIIGNAADNRIEGGIGNDTLQGADGADRVLGGDGDDQLEGDAGNDFLSGGAGDDLASGGDGNDQVFAGQGDIGDDVFIGGDGDDVIGGGAGDDLIIGGGFDDGDTSHLSVSGGDALLDGADTLFGADGNDTVLAGGWDDGLVSDNGLFDIGEQIVSGTDDNVLWAGLGDDIVFGSAGADMLGGRDGNDTLNGGAGNDTIFGGASNHADEIFGGAGDDILFSGAGNDEVNGGAGADTLYDADGNDMYTGGSGVDTFIFSAVGGADQITDFNVNEDVLDLADTFTSFSSILSVLAASSIVSEGVLIDTGAGNSVLLEGVTMAELESVEFVF